jgi:hypothetical protein
VVGVVQPDADDLARSRHGRAHPHVGHRDRRPRAVPLELTQLFEPAPAEECRVEVAGPVGDVEHAPIVEQEVGALGADRSESEKLHRPVPFAA